MLTPVRADISAGVNPVGGVVAVFDEFIRPVNNPERTPGQEAIGRRSCVSGTSQDSGRSSLGHDTGWLEGRIDTHAS